MKTRPTQKFWPLQKQILPPLDLCSRCGIDMCVKKIVPHQPEASPHVTGDYGNMLASHGYFPLIILPTRVNDVSSTLIDHLITNDHKNSIFRGIIKTDLTDHYPIFCSINTFTFSNKLNQQMYKRDLLNFNAENFCEDL